MFRSQTASVHGRRFVLATIALLSASVLAGAPAAAAAATPGVPRTITLVSGNGPAGGADANTELQLTAGGPWRAATVLSSVHGSYGTIAGTKWIGQNANGSGVTGVTVTYRTTFTLPDEFFTPSITVQVHADNDAPDVVLNGVRFGGQPPSGGWNSANFQDPAESFSTADASLFRPGLNTLDITHFDFGNPGGLDYKAVVTFHERLACTLTYTGSTHTPGGAESSIGIALVNSDGAGIGGGLVQLSALSTGAGFNHVFTTGADGTDSGLLPLPAGVYAVSGRFEGDDLYRPCSFDGVTLTVDREATALAYAGDTLTPPGGDTTVAVVLTGVANSINSRSGRAVDVTLASDTESVARTLVTDSTGRASATLSLAPGVYAVTGAFGGDADYLDSAFAETELVVRGATSLAAEPAVAKVATLEPTLTLAATLTSNGAPLAGRTVVFSSGPTPVCEAVTGADGRASCGAATELLPVILSTGYSAAFAGDVVYEASSASAGLVA